MKRTPINKIGKGRKGGKSKGIKYPSVATLDALFSRYIRARAGNECQLWGYTGKPCKGQLQCSHIFSRVYGSVTWDERNAIAACAGCHFQQHRRPLDNAEWIREIVGEEVLDALRETWRTGRKLTPLEKIEKAKWLRSELAKMEEKAA